MRPVMKKLLLLAALGALAATFAFAAEPLSIQQFLRLRPKATAPFGGSTRILATQGSNVVQLSYSSFRPVSLPPTTVTEDATHRFTTDSEKAFWTAKQGALTAGVDYLTPSGSAAGLSNFPTLNQSTTGNAATATRLATPRTINGVSFDGTANITVADSTKASVTNPTFNTNVTSPLFTSNATDGTHMIECSNSSAMSTTGLTSSNEGRFCYDKTLHKFRYWNGTALADMATGGSVSLSTISDWPVAVSSTEVGFLNGVTSGIQTQINSIVAGNSGYVSTPTYSDSSCTLGQWSVSSTHAYFCRATDTWDRVLLAGWSNPQGTDTTPTSFDFVDQSGVALASVITSAPVTITGINAPATISVTNGSYDINGSNSFTTSSGTVSNNNTVRARHVSSASNSTSVTTTVTVGGVNGQFTTTTLSGAGGDPTVLFYFNCNADTATQTPTKGTGSVTVDDDVTVVSGSVGNALAIAPWSGISVPISGNINQDVGTIGMYLKAGIGAEVGMVVRVDDSFMLEATADYDYVWKYRDSWLSFAITDSTVAYVEISWDNTNSRAAVRVNGGTWNTATGLTGTAPVFSTLTFGATDGNSTGNTFDQIMISNQWQADLYSIRTSTNP